MTRKFYSQYEEDKYLNELFKKNNGFCIEIGGYDGITGSNSYFFEELGWKCMVIEPIPDLFEKIQSFRKSIILNLAVSDSNGTADFFIADSVEQLSSLTPDLNRINTFEGAKLNKISVEKKTLNTILEEYQITNIDFISIDVEGHELEVLNGFDLNKYKPNIIIIEDNLEATDNQIEKLLLTYNYILFKRTGCNNWYTLKSNENKFYNKSDLKNVRKNLRKIKYKRLSYIFLKRIIPSKVFVLYKKLLNK